MEGFLQAAPDRSTLIGRAVWKPRFVVIGEPCPADRSYTQQRLGSSRSSASSNLAVRSQSQNLDGMYLTVYKSKDDLQVVHQLAIASVTDAQVQMLAHRKQGPVLPTLVISIWPDPATDTLRKRRSSRAVGLTSTKPTSCSTSLWFRAIQHEQRPLQEWARFIQHLIQPTMPERLPMSPRSPGSATLIDRLSTRGCLRDGSQVYPPPEPRREGAHGHARYPLSSPSWNQIHPHREGGRPMTYFGTPSLRSQRSDLSSSQASSTKMHLQPGLIHYSATHAADMASPATTVGDCHAACIEGRASAQGRSSALSLSVGGRDSFGGSHNPPPTMSSLDSGSPPAPQETILDRAFHLRCIPGSEREMPGEGKMSSLARFEALMRDRDEEKRLWDAQEARTRAAMTRDPRQTSVQNSGDSDQDSTSEDDDTELHNDGDAATDDDVDDDDDCNSIDFDGDQADRFMMPSTKLYTTMDHTESPYEDAFCRTVLPRPQGDYVGRMRSPTISGLEGSCTRCYDEFSALRPGTGYTHESGPDTAPRSSRRAHASQSNKAAMAQATPAYVPAPGLPCTTSSPSAAPMSQGCGVGVTTADALPIKPSPPTLHRSATEKRNSTSSVQRLSFSEFTKRLSSTSSLLLAQAHGSAVSSHKSSSDSQLSQGQPCHTSLQTPFMSKGGPCRPRPTPLPPPPASLAGPDPEEWDKRCSWRGSVGVLASEGGFL